MLHEIQHGAPTRLRRGAAALALAATLLVPAAAQANPYGKIAKDAGLGAASFATTLVYAPFKMAFAAGGFVVGGITWLASGGNDAAALAVMSPTARGDYLVTREQLEGRRALAFVGPETPASSDVAAARGR